MTTVAFVYAHPDDETFGCSYLIRQIADEGGNAVLLTATRGDAGKTGRLGAMTREELAAKRDLELEKAANILGISTVEQLGMGDGKLKDTDPAAPSSRNRRHVSGGRHFRASGSYRDPSCR